MRCAWAAAPRCMLRGPRAYQGVNVHVQRFVCEQHATTDTVAPKTQTTSPTTAHFQPISTRWSALWAPHHLTLGPRRHQTGEMASLEPRHAGDTQPASQLLMVQNPRHRHERRRAADKTWAQRSVSAKKPTQHGASRGPPRNTAAGRTFSRLHDETPPQGELFRACTHTRPSRATNIAHSRHKHGDAETNNTTAHPQQGTTETGIASAPNNCTKNAHFSPAKATAVSIPHRHKQAKAITVSHHRTTSPIGPGCATRERAWLRHPSPALSTPPAKLRT